MKLEQWEEECLAILSEMESGNEGAWRKSKAQLYLIVLRGLGEEWSRKAIIRAVNAEDWRPAPAKLRRIAATLASPIPPVGVLWTEFWNRLISANGRTPRWTHPILEDIALHLGGWGELYRRIQPDLDLRSTESLHRRFEAAFSACEGQWVEQVAQQLALPPLEQEARLFQPHGRYALAPALATPARPALGEAIPRPDYIQLPPPTPRLRLHKRFSERMAETPITPPSDDSARMKAVREELDARRASKGNTDGTEF